MTTLEGVTSDKVLAMPLLAEGGQQSPIGRQKHPSKSAQF
jgi:hypothetical protein